MSLSLEQQEERKKEFTSNIVHEVTNATYVYQGLYACIETRKYDVISRKAETI